MASDPNVKIKAIVLDIEGTITPPSFIKETLLPYAGTGMADYIWDYEPDLSRHLDAVREEEKNHDLNTEEVIEVLLRYVEEGETSTTLQALQGLVLAQGYEVNDIQTPIYEDTLRAFKRWREQRLSICTYSPFSTYEQRLLFAHTQVGSICESFDNLFDTQMGKKDSVESFKRIAASIGVPASEVMFLTNNVEEAVTADNAGMEVVVLDRQHSIEETYGRRIEHDLDSVLPETVPA